MRIEEKENATKEGSLHKSTKFQTNSLIEFLK